MTYQISETDVPAQKGPVAPSTLLGLGRRARALAADYGLLIAFFAGWQIASTTGWLNPAVFPPIDRVASALWMGLSSGALIDDIAISLQRAGIAFAAAVGLGIPLGLFMGQIRAVERALDPILQLFRQTSALALYPVFILLLGLGESSKVFVIFWATLFPILLATIGGVKEVDPKLIEMARTFGATRLTTFRRVVLPASIVGHHRPAAADRGRDDRREQGPRLSGDERTVQLPDPADVWRDLPSGLSGPCRELGAGCPATAPVPLERGAALTL
jgi:sulfonate transport system permease protein